MNKQQLVDKISDNTEYTKATVMEVLNSAMEITKAELSKQGDLTLVGFGTFSVTKRAARKCINPATGKPMKVPAKNAVKFRVGKALAEAVNKKKKK